MRLRKLWRGFGWRGVILLLTPPILAPLVASTVVYGSPFARFELPPTVLAPGPVVGIVLAILFTWGRYERSEKTQEAGDVVPDLVGSTEEYCLILRPFGSDGRVLLSRQWFGSSTVEQVIARAARKSLDLTTYAIVDQQQRLAPPGPVFLKVPNDAWKDAVRALIGRAHSVVLVLPPQQDLRQSFAWEIDQLVQHEMQSRTTIVLPPDRLFPDDYPVALQQACLLIATLEGQGRSMDEVFSLRVLDLEASLENKRVHVAKYSRPHPWDTATLTIQFPKHDTRLVKMVWAGFYLRALTSCFESVRDELSVLDFRSRYPWRRTTGS